MPRRYKKYRASKGSEVYERSWKGKHVELNCEASGVYRRPSENIPSKGISMEMSRSETAEDLSEEMREREAIALAEAERRKKMIAPMYNKGAYQYIGDVPKEILTDLGRKK